MTTETQDLDHAAPALALPRMANQIWIASLPKPEVRSDMTTTYETIGGRDAVLAAVDEFYDRVLDDQTLAPKFEGINLARLKKHQVDFLSTALGGEDVYTGRELSVAHAGLGITDEEFERVVDHLVATLMHLGVAPEIIQGIGKTLMPLRDSIVES